MLPYSPTKRTFSALAHGLHALGPFAAARLVESTTKPGSSQRDAYETLTRREREVLRLVFDGYSNARIASHLSISRRTAESHRANVMHKLDFRNQTDLIKYVLTRAILAPMA